MIYIFDLDGTLCDNRHRLHHITGEKKDYHAYHKACVDDKPLPLINFVSAIQEVNDTRFLNAETILFATGRSDIARQETEEWIYKQTKYAWIKEALAMRKEGDHRHDYLIKEEWLNELRAKHGAWQDIIAFDDRKQCVDMYRRNGVTCCDVAGGEF